MNGEIIMTTEAQIKANQENAKKSTGPTSIEGKQRSSMNAITHGIFAKIPLLPGENEEQFKMLKEDLIKTYQPIDTMEMHLVQRIYLGLIRQQRLQEAEATKLKISMMPEVLAVSVNQILRASTKKEYSAEDLSNRTIESYRYYEAAMKEIEASQFETLEVSIETIEKNMPYTLPLLKEKFKKQYTSSWAYALERPGVIKDLLDKVRFDIYGQLAVLKRNLVGINLFDDLKIIHRIPQGNDMAILSKYQVQLDNDLYRAMNALRDYRNNKAKLIEGEVIEDMAA
jgi:hypothetical protein